MVLTVIQIILLNNSLVERPSTPFSVHNKHRFSLPRFTANNCLFSRSKGVVTDCNTEHAQTGYKIVINRARFVVNYKQPHKQPRPSVLIIQLQP